MVILEHRGGRLIEELLPGKIERVVLDTLAGLQHTRVSAGNSAPRRWQNMADWRWKSTACPIRNQSPISNQRNRARPVPADVRKRVFSKRPVAALKDLSLDH